MEKFIKDGKEVSILLDEGIEELKFTALENVSLSRVNDSSIIELQKDNFYFIKPERVEKEFYKIQVFATNDRDKAEELYLILLKLGFQNIRISEEDDLYKVRIGEYSEENEYKTVITDLKELGLEDSWPVKESKELPEQLYLYNSNKERIFSGTKLIYNGSLRFNEGIYTGMTNFSLDRSKVVIRNRTQLNNLLGGIIGNVFKDLSSNMEQEEFSEIIKVYSVILRTNILYNVFNNGDIINPLFKGIIEDDEIYDNIRRADGIILGGEKENEGLLINEISPTQLSRIGTLIRLGYDYQDILADLFPDSILMNLNEMNMRYTVVDGEVKWGLRYKEIRNINWQGPIVYTVLDLDLSRRNLFFQPVLAQEKVPGLESLASIVRRKEALAGVNGGYFDYTRPLGLVYIDNTLISEPVKDRTALLLTEDNRIIFDRVSWQGWVETLNSKFNIDGVNRKPGNNQIVLYKHSYGKIAPLIKPGMMELVIADDIIEEINYFNDSEEQEGSIIPENGYIIQAHGSACQELVSLKAGEFIYQKNQFSPDFEKNNVKTAISAGPRLIKDGEVFINSGEEEFQADITYGRAPRSAVGISSDNRLVFFTIDGRQPGYSIGVTLKQLAEFMLDYGIIDGMNLDGGHSSSMVVRNFTMNSPSGERLLSNAIIIGTVDID